MKTFVYFLVLIYSSVELSGQYLGEIDELHVALDKAYGLDVAVYNGISYQYNSRANGTPFLEETKLLKSTLFIRSSKYENLSMQYDVCNHVFVLYFANNQGVKKEVVLDNSKVDSVIVGGKKYIKNNYAKIEQPYVQYHTGKKYSLLLTFNKYYSFNGMGNDVGFRYSNLNTYLYVSVGEEIIHVRNKRVFLKFCSSNQILEVKKFLKTCKPNFKKPDYNDIQELVGFINASNNN